MAWVVAVFAAAAALIAVLPGSGTPTPTSAQVEQGLLTVRDLPAGWTRTTPPSMEPNSSSSNSAMTGCPVPFGFGLGSDDSVPAAQAAFVHDSLPRIARMDEVLSYDPATADADDFRAATEMLNGCSHLSMGFGLATIDFQMRPVSLPTLGDRSTAYQLADPNGVDADLIVSVEQDWIVMLVLIALQFPPAGEAQYLTNVALRKLGGLSPAIHNSPPPL